MKKSTYNTYEWICTAVNVLQLAFNTILLFTEILGSKSSTVGMNSIKLRYANNLVIPQYQVDNTAPSMKCQNRLALERCIAIQQLSTVSIYYRLLCINWLSIINRYQ